MDYTSFAPGASNNSNKPNASLPEIPTPIHHRHFPKFIALVVLLLLLGGTAIGSVWYWQNTRIADEPIPAFTPRIVSDDIANWKTYRNEQYGFEFKYPSTLDSIVTNVTSGSNFYERYVSIDVDTPEKISQMKEPNSGSGANLPLFRIGAFLPKESMGDLGCETEPVLKTLIIGGVSATICGGEDIGAPEGLMTLQFARDNIILFSAQSGFYSGSNKQTIDQILSTFKFIDFVAGQFLWRYSGEIMPEWI